MLCTSSKSENTVEHGEENAPLPKKPDLEVEEKDKDVASDIRFDIENVEDTEDSQFSEFVDRLSISEAHVGCNQDGLADMEVSPDLLLQYMRKHETKKLKSSLRGASWGIKHEIRGTLWKNICRHLHKADDHELFTEFAAELFPEDDSADHEIRIPSFVDRDYVNNYYLTTDGIVILKKLLNVLEHYSPDIVFCPLLYDIAALFMHYQSASDCYNAVYALLRSKKTVYINQTKVAHEASKFVVRDLAKKFAKSGYVYLGRQCSNIDSVFDTWLLWIFQDLPFSYLLRVMDCFLLEGMKVLYRVALAIVTLYAKTYAKKPSSSPKNEKSSSNVVQGLRQFCRDLPVKVDKLLKIGFSIRGLTRREIQKLQVKHEMYINSMKHIQSSGEVTNGNKLPMSRSFSGPIILQSTGSNMINLDMLFMLWTWLPTRYAVCQPLLLYTSEEHGTSLVTLYQMIENHQPTVIVIKNTNDEIFGAFCSSCWKERRQQKGPHLSYFGTGETFLFTLSPEKKKYAWVGLTEENIPNTANMFQAGDRRVLTIGGGHGEAISLDESLLHCRTEKCDTFNNEPLCNTEDFTCKVVEVYGFQ